MFVLRAIIGTLVLQLAYGSVIRNPGAPAESLYDSNDKVVVLTSDNIYESTYEQPYASVIEFYNSFCGYCRNFAPIYKRFADDIYRFKDVIRVGAVDCADDANNGVCREMEVMKYPTLRYFEPFYRNDSKNLGIEIRHSSSEVSELQLYGLMENSTTIPSDWPNLTPIAATGRDDFFQSIPSHIDYVFIVNELNQHSYTAQKVALDLHRIKGIQVRRIAAPENAADLGLETASAVYVAHYTQRTINLMSHVKQMNRDNVRTAIEEYLRSKGVRVADADEQLVEPDRSAASATQLARNVAGQEHELSEKDRAIIEHVKANRATVFQSDLEIALRFSIVHELTKYNIMNAEQTNAIQRYVSVLKK